MRTRLAAAAFILISGLAGQARPQTPARPYSSFRLSEPDANRLYSPDFGQCIERDEGSDARASACIEAEFERQDAALNRAYLAAIARQPTHAARARLRADERAWLSRGNRHCDRELDTPPWGTLERVVWGLCALREVVRRTAWLERLR